MACARLGTAERCGLSAAVSSQGAVAHRRHRAAHELESLFWGFEVTSDTLELRSGHHNVFEVFTVTYEHNAYHGEI